MTIGKQWEERPNAKWAFSCQTGRWMRVVSSSSNEPTQQFWEQRHINANICICGTRFEDEIQETKTSNFATSILFVSFLFFCKFIRQSRSEKPLTNVDEARRAALVFPPGSRWRTGAWRKRPIGRHARSPDERNCITRPSESTPSLLNGRKNHVFEGYGSFRGPIRCSWCHYEERANHDTRTWSPHRLLERSLLGNDVIERREKGAPIRCWWRH